MGRAGVRRRGGRASALLAGALGALTLAAVAPASAVAAQPLSWSTPVLVDHQPPFAASNEFNGVDCLSTSLCVGVSDGGKVMTTTNPTAAPSTNWTIEGVDPNNSIAALSCPSVSMCVAVDGSGNTVTSLDPGDGPTATWTVDPGVDGSNSLTSVSCPSTSLCVAGDRVGNLLVTTDPQQGATAHWAVDPVNATNAVQIGGVSCPSASLCVAVDWQGNAFTSSDPGDGAGATWSMLDIDGTNRIDAISCLASPSLCVAVDAQGQTLTSSDPAAGAASHWTSADVDAANQIRAVSCPSSTLCVAVDTKNQALTSTDPIAGASATWSEQVIDSGGFLGFSFPVTISCAPPSASAFCVVGDLAGNSITSTDPVAGSNAAWTKQTHVVGESGLVGMSCPLAALCVAVDNSGKALTTTDPGDGATAVWAVDPGIDSAKNLSSISCVPGSSALCVAADWSGNVVTSTNPGAGTGATWTVDAIDSTNLIDGVSCPTLTLCVAVDTGGNVLTSTNPSASAPTWTVDHVDANTTINGVSCATSSLCVAVDNAGNTLTSVNPAAGTSAQWTVKDLDSGNPLNAVACSASVCAAGDGQGDIFTSGDPASGDWISTSIRGAGSIASVSCPTPTFCAAGDAQGNVVTSTDPANPNPPWVLDPGVDRASDISSLSCVSAQLCAAGDRDGQALSGTGFSLSVTLAGAGSGTVNTGDEVLVCPSLCSTGYAAGSKVTLIANPAPGSVFTGWSGGGCSGTGLCTVTMSSNQNVTATFALAETLTVTLAGSGTGKVASGDTEISCPTICSSDIYQSGDTVTLTATASTGSTFTGWSGGGCSGTAPCTVAMSADESVTATFVTNPTLTVSIAGAGTGAVASGDGMISCPGSCSATYAPGAQVTLTATAVAGSTFTGWSGAGCSGTGPCTTTMSADQAVTATFAANPRLTVGLGGTGAGAVTGSGISCAGICTGSYAPGTVVTLVATPASGSSFGGWSGACTGTGSCVITISADQTVTATFTSGLSAKPGCTLKSDGSRVSAFSSFRGHGRHRHRVAPKRTLKLTARCDQDVTITLTGTVKSQPPSGKGKHHPRARTFHLRHVTGHARSGVALVLTVKLPAAALKRGARDSATFNLSAADAQGTGAATATLRHLTLF